MSDLSYVRTEILPEKDPPVTEVGIIGWMRQNLFDGWFNATLTIVSVAVLYSIISAMLPWFLHGVWNAGSLNECRSIIKAEYGPDATGACWGVIKERGSQLMYGFYPRELRWRIDLSFLLMLAALAPVLFSNLPRKMLWFSAVYPFIGYWLLWGGSVWGPIMVLAGVVLAAVAFSVLLRVSSALVAVIAAIFVPILWWTFSFTDISMSLQSLASVPGLAANGIGILAAVAVFVSLRNRVDIAASLALSVALFAAWWALVSPILTFRITILMGQQLSTIGGLEFLAGAAKGESTLVGLIHSAIPLSIEPVESSKFGGFTLSVTVGLTGIVASLPIGILLALGRQADMFIVKRLSIGFIEFIRGVPLITLLFVAHLLLNYFMPPGTHFALLLRVIIMVTLFASAYLAEVIRGGLASLPKGQYEAADALGLDYWKSMRLIILPQALKVSIPGIVQTFIGLFKDTTLVYIIGLMDPLGLLQAIRADENWNGIIWELYGFIGAVFFLFCFAMSRYSMYLERKLQTGHR